MAEVRAIPLYPVRGSDGSSPCFGTGWIILHNHWEGIIPDLKQD